MKPEATLQPRRLVVLNGHRVLQLEEAGEWINERVEKAKGLRPGVYELFKAVPADQAVPATGVVVHVDAAAAYIQTDAGLFRHDLSAFDHSPPIGGRLTVTYDGQGRATLGVPPAEAPAPKKRSR